MSEYDTPLALAKDLIRRASYVSADQDEIPALECVEAYVISTIPTMTVERQYLTGSRRYNLIIKGKKPPRLLVLGHIDTVQPKQGWVTDPLTPFVKDGRLYGLGAADMKSSLAAFLWTLAQVTDPAALDTVMLLVYVDEEYDFKGMLRFIEEDLSNITPQMTLSLDGSLEVSTGCRGVIELNLAVGGQSGHASNPSNGVNAITGVVDAVQATDAQLAAYSDPVLGRATANLAALIGGTLSSGDANALQWNREGNVIPDRVEMVLEVRTPVAELNAARVLKLVETELTTCKLRLIESEVRHDIAPWPAAYNRESLKQIARIYQEADVPFVQADETLRGYIDAQMVAERVQAPTYIIGTGGQDKHGANESVAVQDIDRAARIYKTILNTICS